jgi:hypothetical protein
MVIKLFLKKKRPMKNTLQKCMLSMLQNNQLSNSSFENRFIINIFFKYFYLLKRTARTVGLHYKAEQKN